MTARELQPAGRVVERLRLLVSQAATDDEARALAEQIRAVARRRRLARWEPYVWQHPHRHPEGWTSLLAPGVCDHRCADLPPVVPGVHEVWRQRGGRGTGKTEGAAHYINAHAEGPACDPRVPGGHRFTIVAPTQADAVSACVEGVSGLKALNPGITISTGREGTTIRWPNGSVGRLLGAHTVKDVERARAWTNVCVWWLEEAAAMNWLGGLAAENPEKPEGMLDQAPFTLRLGPNPHIVATTTPKNRPEVTALLNMPGIETWGRTQDAHRLPDAVRESLERRFGDTTLGEQELGGKQIADTPGALWVSVRPETVNGAENPDKRPGIGNTRVMDPATIGWHSHLPDHPAPPDGALIMERTIVAVDPPGGRTEAGISVMGVNGRTGYVLADLSLAAPPATWARVAINAYLKYGAEGIAAEHAYGGDMVTEVIQGTLQQMQADGEVPLHIAIPIFKVPTKVGKRLRAEPVVAKYQQGLVRHVGLLPLLESEQTSWIPDQTKESPNRIDALVHAGTFLLVRTGGTKIASPVGVGRVSRGAGSFRR